MNHRTKLWDEGEDEAVSVNQRALIDKVLARYSGENTIFRELLQNADDAGATSVQIRFYTKAGAEAKDATGGEGVARPSSLEETVKPKRVPDFKTDEIHRYVFLNDGQPFRPEDWARLKSIASGNPDESKIGAFGVGFYSLFSITEEPYVESNGTWMAFHWKGGGDQLFARAGALSPDATTPSPLSPFSKPWTSFSMDLRSPSPMPSSPLDLARFLTTSLTFMQRIIRAELFLDDLPLVLVEKEAGTAKLVEVPQGLERRSEGGMMRVEGIESTGVRMSAKILRMVYQAASSPPPPPKQPIKAPAPATSFASMLSSAFFSRSTPSPAPLAPPVPPPRPKDPFEALTTTLNLKIMAADVSVTISRAFAVELERATKKAPPSKTQVAMVFTGREEWEAGEAEAVAEVNAGGTAMAENERVGTIWRGLRADLDGRGLAKVFIGHATGQTTGIGGHISARFIPTVERESIDLVDRHVAIWNKELLYIAGFLARAIYELECYEVRMLWQGSSSGAQPAEDVRKWLIGRALHALRFFTFHTSTPSATVSRQIEAAFFACSKTDLSIISTRGIFDAAREVRMPHDALAKFVTRVPVVPQEVLTEAGPMVARLRERGLLRDVLLEDVLGELKSRVLNEQEMIACLQWWIALSEVPGFDTELKSRLLDVAVFTPSSTDEKMSSSSPPIALASIESYYDPRRSTIPADVPLPLTSLPFAVSKALQTERLPHALGFRELSLADWIAYIVSPALTGSPEASPEMDIAVSAVFAERVLGVIAKAFQAQKASSQARIFSLLSDQKIIPSRSGMVTPGEAYFPNVSLFPDLPIIAFPKSTPIKGSMEKLLTALGVRRHVELQLVFNRLLHAGGWTVFDLVKYLVSVRDELSATEMDKLRNTPAFPVEGLSTRQTPASLFEPTDELRKLKLPILDWGTVKWRSNSDEAKLLFSLGVQRHPSLETLLPLAAHPTDISLRSSSLEYFFSHFYEVYKDMYLVSSVARSVAFVPSIRGSDATAFLATPSETFTNGECAVLGFNVVASSARVEAIQKLKILSDPPAALLAETLVAKPPRDQESARKIFEYLASRISNFSSSAISRLQTTRIVPVTKTGKDVQMRLPSEVYFIADEGAGLATDKQASAMYRALFTYIDFGPKANTFLRSIGVQPEPTIAEVAKLLVKNPQRVLNQAGTSAIYLDVLRSIASSAFSIPNATRKEMTIAPMLLGQRRVRIKAVNGAAKLGDQQEDDDYELVSELAKASDIAILDDPVSHSLFVEHILGCPEEIIFEDFYISLGSQRLSSRVKSEYRVDGSSKEDSILAKNTKALVLERLPLFLHEQPKVFISTETLRRSLRVVEVRSLQLKRTYTGGSIVQTRTEPASAAATRSSSSVILTISGALELDLYEVAATLVRLVVAKPRPADALLLLTILSTPLTALKRRGYNIDRILKAKKAERLALEQAEKARSAENDKLASDAREIQELFPDCDPEYLAAVLAAQPADENRLTNSSNALLEKPYPKRQKAMPPPPSSKPLLPQALPTSSTGLLGSKGKGLFNRMQESIRRPSPSSSLSNGSDSTPNPTLAGEAAERPTNVAQATQRAIESQKSTTITPPANIKAAVEKAVNASRGNRSSSLVSDRQITPVREAKENYCDTTGAHTNLGYVAEQRDTKLQFYVDKAVPNPQQVMTDLAGPLARFAVKVVVPLGDVFKLNPSSLHIFYDLTGPLIAFNRGGSLFVNLRYYMAWHDEAVKAGKTSEALTNWYFSLAHEIAHNIIKVHDSQFAYWSSSIAEQFLAPLNRLLLAQAVPS